MPARVLWSCAPAFLSALSLCSRCVACKICLISRFKGVFRAFCGVRVGLCCLGALRGLCGFCARVELGGLKDCGVFASAFIFSSSAFILSSSAFHLLRLSSGALSLLSSACPVCLFCLFLCLCGSLCFLFPLRYMHKKKGRKVFSLRPLFVCCVCSNSCNVIEELRCRCFRSF